MDQPFHLVVAVGRRAAVAQVVRSTGDLPGLVLDLEDRVQEDLVAVGHARY